MDEDGIPISWIETGANSVPWYYQDPTPTQEWNAPSPVGSPEEEEAEFFDNNDYIDFDDEDPDENYDECEDPDCSCHRR